MTEKAKTIEKGRLFGTEERSDSADVRATHFEGSWSGSWGDLFVKQQQDGTLRGAYSKNEGTITGRVVDGVFKGWWCGEPSRMPGNEDAGDFEFRYVPDNPPKLDGRWRYGTSGTFVEDWDLTRIDSVPAAYRDRINDDSQFCTHP